MYGYSYPGLVQLLAAATRPPSLAAICPGFTSSQAYDGWIYSHGAIFLGWAMTWALFLAHDTARRNGDDEVLRTRPLGAPARDRRVLDAPARRPGAARGARAPELLPRLDRPSDPRRLLEALEHRRRLLADHRPGAPLHRLVRRLPARDRRQLRRDAGGRARRAAAGRVAVDARAVDARVGLRRLEPGVHERRRRPPGLVRPPAQGHAASAEAAVSTYILHDGWRDFPDWPPPETRTRELYLRSGGRANSRHGDGALSAEAPGDEPADVYTYDPDLPTWSAGGHSCCDASVTPMGPEPQDAAESTKAVLVYTSEPLAGDVTLAGNVEVVLHAASTAVDTDFVARLCAVDPDGVSRNLQEGLVRARYRNGFEAARAARARRAGRVSPAARAGRASGSRRATACASTSRAPTSRCGTGTSTRAARSARRAPRPARVAVQTVFHDTARPSRVVLPVFEGEL